MNDLARASHQHQSIVDVVSHVIRSGWYINGPQNIAFGKAFSSRIGVKHFIGVANGTDALQLSLAAVIANSPNSYKSRNAEVVMVSNAGGYASTACFALGCVPVYCDIEIDDQLMSVTSAVSALTEKTVAVVATHLYGGLVDVARLRKEMDFAGFVHVAIIEDCAQAHGLDAPAGPAGSLGNIAAFSFYPTKNLGAMGDGGAVLTNDESLAVLVDQLRQYGWSGKYNIAKKGGMNSRLDEIQAAILHARLPHLDNDNRKRRAIIEAYTRAAPSSLKVISCARGTVGHLAVVLADKRDAFREHLASQGVSTDIHYPVLDSQQLAWRNESFRIAPSGLANSERSVTQIVSVPCFPEMTEEQIERVCRALSSFGAQ